MVQLKRAGQVVREFDLYAFLARGDNSGDIKLIDGDVIVIPPALGHVAMVGKVNNPAVYELKRSDETLAEILDVAGGLPVVADPRTLVLWRSNLFGSSAKGNEYFLKNLLGTHSNLLEPGHPNGLHKRFISLDYARMVAGTGGVIGDASDTGFTPSR